MGFLRLCSLVALLGFASSSAAPRAGQPLAGPALRDAERRPPTTLQTATGQLGRLFRPPPPGKQQYQVMPFAERIARIVVSWTLLFAAKSLLLASPLYFRKLIETGSQFVDLQESSLPTTLVAASALGLIAGYGGSRLAAGVIQLISELILSPATTISAEGLPLEAFACALAASSQRGDSSPLGQAKAGPRAPLSAIAAAAGGQDEGRAGFARRALDRGLRASNQFLYRSIFSLLPAIVEGLAVLALICMRTSYAVGATAGVVALVFVVSSASIMKARIPIMRRLLQQEGAANGLAEDALSLAETVAAFGGTAMEVDRYSRALSRVSRAAITVRFTFSALKMLQALILAVGASAVALVTWRQATSASAFSLSSLFSSASASSSGLLPPHSPRALTGQLVLVQALFAQLCAPLDHVGQHFRDCVSAAEDLRELEELKAAGQGAWQRASAAAATAATAAARGLNQTQSQPQAQAQGRGRGRERPPPKLEIRNVSFAFPTPRSAASSSPSSISSSSSNNSSSSSSSEAGARTRAVLRGVSLAIPQGGYAVGLVGPSGCGKTTLLRLLLGLEDLRPTTHTQEHTQSLTHKHKHEQEHGSAQVVAPLSSGQLFVDGVDVSAQHRVPLFSMVGQESDLFRGLNLVGNVRYGSAPEELLELIPSDHHPHPQEQQQQQGQQQEQQQQQALPLLGQGGRDWTALQNAARDAQLAPLLLHHGWGGAVGPRGRLLSGGERQRVCLARALYRQELLGGILLMDEVTASLDAQTEDLITRAIMGRVKKGATAVLVAHRMSSVRGCDVILVLKDGEVVERGSHQQLMKRGGWYAQAVRLQGQGGDGHRHSL